MNALDACLDRLGAPLLCGHRGARATHPENTMPALAAALEAGCAAVELDVRVTADGALAVIHDATVDRTTDGTGEVEALTVADLRRLDAGAWRGAEFAGSCVPLLEEVLELCRGRALVLAELKSGVDSHPHAPRLIAQAVERISGRGGALLLAFDHRHLARGRTVAPWLGRVALCDAAPADPVSLLAGLDAVALAPRRDAVDAVLCAAVHAAGRRVVTWTVNDPDEAVRLAGAGVDVVITDDPLPVGRALERSLRR